MSHSSYCARCGRTINLSRGRLCGPCTYEPLPSVPTEEHALPDGDWVLDPVRRVLVFRRSTPPPIQTVDRMFPRRWGALAACPTCEVAEGEPCRIPTGMARRPHAARVNVGKRWCQEGCGTELTGHYKQRFCDVCKVKRKKEQDAAAFARWLERKAERDVA